MPQPSELTCLRTLRDLVRWGASEFGRAGLWFGHGTGNALDEAFYLVRHALKLPHDLPEAYLDAVLTETERQAVLALLRTRVASRKPAAYLTGEAWFCGLPFHVDERVLIPRSPIAELIEQRFQPWLTREPEAVLDLCTGSGCIAIACALAFPEAGVDAVELDEGALAILERNVARHHVQDQVRAVRGDLFAGVKGRKYDLIVTNPPYVPSEEWESLAPEYHHEPRLALDAGQDGLDVVDRILREAVAHLLPGGLLVCEVGGSMPQFFERYSVLPVVWPEFERGGDGVFVISREDLMSWKKKHVRK